MLLATVQVERPNHGLPWEAFTGTSVISGVAFVRGWVGDGNRDLVRKNIPKFYAKQVTTPVTNHNRRQN